MFLGVQVGPGTLLPEGWEHGATVLLSCPERVHAPGHAQGSSRNPPPPDTLAEDQRLKEPQSPNFSACTTSGSQVTSKQPVTQRRSRALVPASSSIPLRLCQGAARLAGTTGCAVQVVTCGDQTALQRETKRCEMGGKLARVMETPSLAWKLLSLCTKVRYNSSVAGGDLYTTSG